MARKQSWANQQGFISWLPGNRLVQTIGVALVPAVAATAISAVSAEGFGSGSSNRPSTSGQSGLYKAFTHNTDLMGEIIYQCSEPKIARDHNVTTKVTDGGHVITINAAAKGQPARFILKLGQISGTAGNMNAAIDSIDISSGTGSQHSEARLVYGNDTQADQFRVTFDRPQAPEGEISQSTVDSDGSTFFEETTYSGGHTHVSDNAGTVDAAANGVFTQMYSNVTLLEHIEGLTGSQSGSGEINATAFNEQIANPGSLALALTAIGYNQHNFTPAA